MKEVAVIGGGAAGLSALCHLRAAGIRDVTLYESTEQCGGVVSTTEHDGFRFEWGPNTVLSSAQHVQDLVRMVGLEDDFVYSDPRAKARLIFKDGRIRPLPTGPFSLLGSGLMPFGGRIRMMTEPWRKAPETPIVDETLAEFFSRRIGPKATYALADPFVSGVYAGDPHQLWACAFPMLQALEAEHGSLIKGMKAKRKAQPQTKPQGLLGLKKGWGHLMSTIRVLHSDAISLGHQVQAVAPIEGGWEVSVHSKAGQTTDRFKNIILATPAYVTSRLIQTLLPAESAALAQIPHPPLIVVGLGYRREDIEHPLKAFGLLCHSESKVPDTDPILGILFPSTIFPDRAPASHVSLAVMMGGVREPDIVEGSEETWIARATSAVKALLKSQHDPVVASTWLHKQAVPQYLPGHDRMILQIEHALGQTPGLYLAGSYLKGVSFDEAVGSGARAAAQVTS